MVGNLIKNQKMVGNLIKNQKMVGNLIKNQKCVEPLKLFLKKNLPKINIENTFTRDSAFKYLNFLTNANVPRRKSFVNTILQRT